MALSIISLLTAVVALLFNVSALQRRPRFLAAWGDVRDEPQLEALFIIVTARRRPIQVDEIGLVLLSKRPHRSQRPEWHHQDRPQRIELRVFPSTISLPVRLQDGESVRAGITLHEAETLLLPATGIAFPYVRASGTVYLARRNSKIKQRLRAILDAEER